MCFNENVVLVVLGSLWSVRLRTKLVLSHVDKVIEVECGWLLEWTVVDSGSC